MGFRFRKSIKAGPIRINLSKSGIGYSVGTKGLRYTKKANGGTRTTYSIPGTGLSYVTETGSKKEKAMEKKKASNTSATPKTASESSISASGTQQTSIYCPHCYRMVDSSVNLCPNCGKSLKSTTSRTNRKHGWQYYVGIFCIFGAIVMLFENIAASLFYAVIAFLLLRNNRQLAREKESLSSYSLTTPAATSNSATDLMPNHSTSVSTDIHAAPSVEPATSTVNTLKTSAAQEHANTIVQALHEETLRELYGDDNVSSLLDVENSPPAESKNASKSDTKSFTARVTGMEHYIDNLMNLAVENPDYDMSKKEIVDNGMDGERIYEYDFYASTVMLVPEPENIYNKNAVKVVIDGEHVGYIKQGSCSRILKLLREDRIQRIEAEVGGGNYKVVYEDYDDDTYTLERDKTNHFVHLTIYEKEFVPE